MSEQFLPELKQRLQQKLLNFKGGFISTKLKEWAKITPEPEILETVKGLTLEFLEEPSIKKLGMKSGQNSLQIMSEVNRILK